MEAGRQKKIDSFVRWRAWARQTLGLTLSEFERLTPREIDIELEVSEEIRRRRDGEADFLLRLLDAHMSTLETITYNASYKRPMKVEDFKLLREKKKEFPPELVALDAKLRAQAQERIRQKRKGL